MHREGAWSLGADDPFLNAKKRKVSFNFPKESYRNISLKSFLSFRFLLLYFTAVWLA